MQFIAGVLVHRQERRWASSGGADVKVTILLIAVEDSLDAHGPMVFDSRRRVPALRLPDPFFDLRHPPLRQPDQVSDLLHRDPELPGSHDFGVTGALDRFKLAGELAMFGADRGETVEGLGATDRILVFLFGASCPSFPSDRIRKPSLVTIQPPTLVFN